MRSLCKLGILFVMVCWLSGCDDHSRSKPRPSRSNAPAVGQAAPEIDGKDLNGAHFSLSDYKGKVVLLDFWGMWCPPCRRFLPHGKDLVERYKGRPFVALGVNTDRDTGLPLKSKDLAMRCWTDPRGETLGPICSRWEIEGFPTVYLIDQQGIIRRSFVGLPADISVLDDAVEELVKKAEGKS